MKIHGMRYGILGDTIGSLPLLTYFDKIYPNSYKTFAICKKISHVAPLLLNHPNYDKLQIFDGTEGPETSRDFEPINAADQVINGNPQHPFQHDWPNYRTFYEETVVMAGVDLKNFKQMVREEERLPRLYKWFRDEPRPSAHKTIVGCWSFAGYAKEPRRSPSKQWYEKLILRLAKEDIAFAQFGHPNDPIFFDNPIEGDFVSNYEMRFNELDFFQQIRMTLSCDIILGTDSGSGLIFAAYDLLPQINFISCHWPGHVRNPYALAPQGPQVCNMFGKDSCDNISINQTVENIKEML